MSQLLVNDIPIDHGSYLLKLDEQVFEGVTAIKWDKRAGKVRLGGSVQALRQHLACKSANGRSFGNVEFPIVLQYTQDGRTRAVEFERCVWEDQSGPITTLDVMSIAERE